MVKVNYTIQFPTSVYAALEKNNRLYVGGSDWNRRKILYTKSIANKSKGILYILRKTKSGFVREKKILFPHMIYTILELSNSRIFIGCKAEKGRLNIIDEEGSIIKQKNDIFGKGIYNSVFNPKQDEIILATRSGKLEIVDSSTLELKTKLQLTTQRTRVWSIRFDERKQTIYAGDYNGVLYVISRSKFNKKDIIKFDLKNLYSGE